MPRGGRERHEGERVSSPIERIYGVHPVREALRARRRRLHRLRFRQGRRRTGEALLEEARRAGVAVDEVAAEHWATAAPDASTQGVILEAGPLPELPMDELARSGPEPRTLVALDGVEDPQNLGAIARVAESAGVNGLILTRRRSAPLSPAAVRASAGALEWLPVTRVPNLGRALNDLKSLDYWIFGGDPEGEDGLWELSDRALRGHRVLVLGAEGRGLRPGVKKHLDHRVKIPMAGRLESLNVSTAAAVLLFEFARRTRVANTC